MVCRAAATDWYTIMMTSRIPGLQVAAGFVEYSSFSEATDAGMACAWNPSGTLLAAGYQDGSLIIWDPRAHRV